MPTATAPSRSRLSNGYRAATVRERSPKGLLLNEGSFRLPWSAPRGAVVRLIADRLRQAALTASIIVMMAPEAAVAIVHARAPEESVLLMRRTVREGDPWSGQWSFPGGRCEPQDAGPQQTALRELEEECGIHLSSDSLTLALPNRLARRKVGRFLLVAPFVFAVSEQLATVPCPRETAEALWIPLRLLRDPARHYLQPVPGQLPQMLYPGIDLNGVPLWGFTYRLITDWLEMGPSCRPIEQAGFEAAGMVLDFLRAQGLPLLHGWRPGADAAMVASVEGVIPTREVLQHFSKPGDFVPAVNRLHVEPDAVRIFGPAFEEYIIQTVG